MPPGDDIWRYIWEGMIQLTGHNPYNTAPDHVSLLELRPSWWRHINNENVTAIYPPLAQLIFRLTAGVSASVIGFKVLFVLADILTGALLWKKDTKLAAFYLLNPLILYCFAGGAHYEPLFLLPLIASWLIWETKPSGSSLLTVGLLIGTSLAIKLIAIFSGYYVLWQLILSFMRKPHVRQAKHIASFLLGIFLVPTLSLVGFCYLSGIPDQWYPSTFVEDARSASLIPWFLEHYNSDPHFPYPNSLFACLLAVLLVPIFLFSKTFHGLQRRTLLTLLVCSPMVHAWYFTWLIPFCVKGHRIVIGFLSTTAFLYFLLPYRLATEGKWDLLTVERLLLWSPYLLLITTPLAYLRKTKS